MIIWYIHGAGASERSFAWLHEQLDEFGAEFFSYDVDEPAISAVVRLSQAIEIDGRPALLLGHSLGGVIAMVCASLSNVEQVVTLCAPFGGVKYANLFAMFSSHPLIHDVRSHGSLLSNVRDRPLNKPHLAIVGSRGLPFMNESNDGVVTVASQTALRHVSYEILPINHFEVLLSSDVVDLIKEFMCDQQRPF